MFVKNLRPGVLILPDADLRLAPGETAKLATETPHVRLALNKQYLVEVAPPSTDSPAEPSLPGTGNSANQTKEKPESPTDLSKLNVQHAVAAVRRETDTAKLAAWRKRETRRTVLEAIKFKLDGR